MGGGDRHPEESTFHADELHKPAPTYDSPSNDTDHAIVSKLAPPLTSLLIRLITHNIRYAATGLFHHERPWPERLPNLLRQFHHYADGPFNPPSTILCLQEVLRSQLDDLVTALGFSWSHVGVGRDDGKDNGEFNPIFFQHRQWEKVHFETIWLSETPDRPSLGWHAGSKRLCTCLVLQRKESGSEMNKVMILNTHLDNASPVARRKGAELILSYAKQWRKDFQVDSALLLGDLNSTSDESHGAWEVLNASDSGFVDVQRFLRRADVRRFGDEVTFTGFDGNGDDDTPRTLDFVHYGMGEGETIIQANKKLESYSVIPNLFDDGVRCSDHRAVVVDFVL